MAKPPRKSIWSRVAELEKRLKPDNLSGWTSDDMLYAMRYDEAPRGLVMPVFPRDDLDDLPDDVLMEMARENWIDTFGDEPMPEWLREAA